MEKASSGIAVRAFAGMGSGYADTSGRGRVQYLSAGRCLS